MRDVIAVLDGMNVSASAGANYSGGSSWAAGFPTMPSSEGLAGYLAAFDGGNGYDVARVNPSASSGGNYSGGSSWAAGFPTYPSSEGLASMGPTGYDVTRVNPSASGGANYSGGSSWAAGFPLYPSSEGLASVRIRGALHGLTGGGVSPAAAVAIVRRAVQSGAIVAPRPGGTRIPHPCNAARDAAYSAAREAGFDLAFCEAAGVRAFNRCVAESWATYGTKS